MGPTSCRRGGFSSLHRRDLYHKGLVDTWLQGIIGCCTQFGAPGTGSPAKTLLSPLLAGNVSPRDMDDVKQPYGAETNRGIERRLGARPRSLSSWCSPN